MSPLVKTAAKYIPGLLLAALLLFLIFRGTEPAEIGRALTEASIGGLIVSGLLQIGHNVFRVWRWGVLLRALPSRPTQRGMWVAVLLGYLVSWVLPGRLGEIVRPALLSGREDIPLVPCVGTVVVDRLLDMLTVFAVFSVGVIVSPLPEDLEFATQLRLLAYGLLPTALGSLVVLALLARFRGPLSRRFAERPGLIARGFRTALDLVRAGDALYRPTSLLLLVLTSVGAWAMIVTGLWIGFDAAGTPLPFFAVCVLTLPIAFGGALPTPGGAGGFHFFVMLGLTQIFMIERSLAASSALLLHLTSLIPPIVAGCAILAIGIVRWSDVTGIVRQARQIGRMRTEGGAAS